MSLLMKKICFAEDAEGDLKMDDLTSREEALEAINRIWNKCEEIEAHLPEGDPDKTGYKMIADYLTVWKYLSAQPEIKPIDYRDCANAMLKMWMLDVVTDGEYYRIMDKLNAFELKRRDKEGD